jgi:hypothetical protein
MSSLKKDKNGRQSFSMKVKAPAENPFDKFANSRKKHEVINRRVKGEDRNVGRARAKVVFHYYLNLNRHKLLGDGDVNRRWTKERRSY